MFENKELLLILIFCCVYKFYMHKFKIHTTHGEERIFNRIVFEKNKNSYKEMEPIT